MNGSELWERLSADGLVEGALPHDSQVRSPWYVRIMLGIAGWIGALFLFAFVGAAFAFVLKDGPTALIAGAICCGVAATLLRKFDTHDFAAQFALALSLAGQALILVGLVDFLKPEDPPLYFAIAAVQAALAMAVPNFLHRMLAVSGAAIAFSIGLVQLSLHGLAAPLLCAGLAWLWLEPGRWARRGTLWRPIGYGIMLALLLVETFRLFGLEDLFRPRGKDSGWMALHGPLLGRAIMAALLVGVAVILSGREGHAPGSRPGLAAAGAALLVGLLSLNAPGLAPALIILLLGFAAGNRILMALGVLSLLGFVTHFYYSLHATLLEKSGLLAITGLALLAAHFVLRRVWSGDGKEAHA